MNTTTPLTGDQKSKLLAALNSSQASLQAVRSTLPPASAEFSVIVGIEASMLAQIEALSEVKS